MKHQQVVPDYIVMLESSITVLALVACGWLLFKLVSACIWFPQYMKNLEVEASKANQHLEDKLLPKESAVDAEGSKTPNSDDAKSDGSDDEAEKAPKSPKKDSKQIESSDPAIDDATPETKKDK